MIQIHHFFRMPDQLTEKLAALPGVTQVSASSIPVLTNSSSSQNISLPGYAVQKDDDDDSNFNAVVGADYFRSLGIPLIGGREFSASDGGSGPRLAVVNEAFAKHFFAGRTLSASGLS